MSENEVSSATADPGSRRHSTLVAAGILLSRLSGFVRERAVGHYLGLTFAANAFAAAFRIPNLLQNLLGEGVLSASFIPVYARLLDDGRDEEAGRVAGAIAGLLTAVAGAIAVLGVVFAEAIISVLTPGLLPQEHDLAVTLMRILTPGIAFLVLSAWCLGILNSHRRFFLSYVAPVLWNAAQIAAIVGAGAVLVDGIGDGVTDADLVTLAAALSWGALVGGLLQFLVQLPSVLRLTRGLRPSLRVGIPGVRRTLRAFGPVVAGRGVVQVLTFVDVVLASLLAGAALAALQKAQMLYVLPISLFGMSVAAAELPAMSSASAQQRETLASRLDEGLARIAFYVVPTVVAYLTLGDVIVGALFRTGNFDRVDVLTVWLILIGFSVGLLANTSSRLLQSALYGGGDARTPAKLAALRVILAAAIGAVLMLQLDRVVVDGGLRLLDGASLPAFTPLSPEVREAAKDMGRNHLGAAGLSVAAGMSAWVEYRLLRRHLERRLDRPIEAGGGALPRILVAAGITAVVTLLLRALVADLHPILAALIAGPIAAGVYLLTASRLGLDEAGHLLGMLRRRAPD